MGKIMITAINQHHKNATQAKAVSVLFLSRVCVISFTNCRSSFSYEIVDIPAVARDSVVPLVARTTCGDVDISGLKLLG